MATAGSIVVDLLMRTGSFETDADRAAKQVKKLGKDSSDSAAQVGAAFGKIGGVVAGGLTVATVAVVNWTRQLVVASAEVEKLSRLSGTSEQTFQRLAAGASTVGIQQDKLGDIFKDTQDKLGDFLSTGGGAMKDFFEQIAPRVNLTADAFRNLSGPEVLQKYYKALEDAGASQADMVFYMEAIASDSAMLAPLLANNGEGFRKWGAEAERVGAILDGPTIAAMKEVKDQSNQMDLAFQGLRSEVATQLLPQFRDLVQLLGAEDTKRAFTSIAGFAADIAGEMANGVVQIASFITRFREMRRLDGAGDADLAGASEDALNQKIGELGAVRRAMLAAEGDNERTAKESQRLMLEMQRVQRELTRRYKAENAAENFKGVTGSVDSTGRIIKPQEAGSFRATVAADKDKTGENAAKRLAEALKSANQQLERQIALYGDASELSRVTYEIQFGGLKGVDEASQSALRSGASLLDMLGNIDEAEAIMAEDAQRFADAFNSMLGRSDEASEEHFSQISTYADQAARNMQDAFADFLFDPFSDGLGGMVDSFADAIKRMAAEAAAAQIFERLGSWASSYSGAGSSLINAIGGAFGAKGNRAGGGPAAGYDPYRVGEGGRPELFEQGGKTYLIPGDAGTVRPITAGRSLNGPGAGGAGALQVVINNHTSGRVTTREENGRMPDGSVLRRMIVDVISDDLANGGQVAAAGRQRFGWSEAV
ncbi:hypothetical protein [Stenotrophomonas chelatiphaga]|uniref:hypothetical protein n=1 Tax=Stenotrophomonas chelatiphaga TaxID=517011 RepID=UPI0028A24C9A|nr:hypothetical protein [Stenotrophomonas chelatiphaga]